MNLANDLFSLSNLGFQRFDRSWGELVAFRILQFTIIFLFFSLGIDDLNLEIIASLLSMLCILSLFLPWKGEPSGWVHIKETLKLHPALWVAGLFFLYLAIQNFNTSFAYESMTSADGLTSWRLIEQSHIPFLPSGIAAPADIGNGWRTLINFAGPALLIIATLTIVRNSRNLAILLWTIFMAGIILSIYSIAVRFLGTPLIQENIETRNPNFIDTFAYFNFTVAALYLSLASGLSLFCIYRRKALSFGLSSRPYWGILFFGLIICVGIFVTGSRVGIALSSTLLVTFLAYWLLSELNLARRKVRIFIVTGLFLFFLGCFIWVINSDLTIRLDHRTQFVSESGEVYMTEERRRVLNELTGTASQDAFVFGWGAGSFRYVFPIYQIQSEEELLFRDDGGRAIFTYAHNDWLQFVFEYGVIGSIMLLLIILFWGGTLYGLRNSLRWTQIFLIAGIFLLLMHGLMDFVLQKQSLLGIAGVMLALTIRDAQIKNNDSQQRD